jgi:hypothetical protein
VRSIALFLSLSAAVFAAAAQSSSDRLHGPARSHEHAEPITATDAPGKRWSADGPLRSGMQQIRNARANRVRSPADAHALAEAIDDAVAYMIRNCSLPPDADAALHGVIGQLASAASALRREEDPRAAISMVDAALDRYEQLFDESD